MNARYLTSAKISNFRTYGPDFTVSFPDGPSLTVVCGMNGLGKTTLFDAIEWALLGDIQRFQEQHLSTASSPLTRREAPRNSHQVELAWGNERVTRTHKHAPSDDSLRRILIDPNWGPGVQDLAVYLRLTHFLPQSNGQRFLKKDEKERWSLLKGPTGVERLERFRHMLGDIKARNAFERRIEYLKLHMLEALREQTTWVERLSDQKRWTTLAQVGSAVPPEQVQTLLQELLQSVQLSLEPRGEIADRLVRARQELVRSIQQGEGRVAQLSTQEKAVPQYEALLEKADALRRTLAGLEPQIKQAEKEKTELKRQFDDEKQKLAQAEESKSNDNARSLQLLALIESLAAREQQQREMAALDERARALGEELAKLRLELEGHRRVSAERENLVQRANTARERLSNLDYVDRLATDARGQDEQIAILEKEITALEAKRAMLSSTGDKLEQEAAQVELKVRETLDALEKAKRDTDVVAAARTTIIEHITQDDRICPVCSHEHPPGELLRQAHGKFQDSHRKVGLLLEALKKIEQTRDALRGRQNALRAELTELEFGVTSRKQQVAASAVRIKTLLSHPLVVGVALNSVNARLGELRAESSSVQKEVSRQIDLAKPADEMLKIGKELEQREQHVQNSLREIEINRGSFAKRIQDHDAKLKASDKLLGEFGGAAELTNARNAMLRRISETEANIIALRSRHDLLQSQGAALDHKLVDLFARRRADQLALESRDKEMAVIVRAWTALGLEGAPSSSALVNARTRSEQATLGLKRALERLQQAANGLEAWNSHQELVRISESLAVTRQRVGAQTDEECSAKLAVIATEATAAVDKATKTSLRAGEVADGLMQRSSEFSRAALDPLGSRVSAFHQLISPFRYEVEMKPHLTGTSGKAQTRLVVPGLKGTRSSDENPDLWLSEGQASALGLSVLLGASTVYRWSAWRALLLDDPLQNTDLIHAAAFGDVIRSLMQDKCYQVILSTHNPDEADFLLRKVRRAGLPVQRLDLVSLSPDGVRYELRDQ